MADKIETKWEKAHKLGKDYSGACKGVSTGPGVNPERSFRAHAAKVGDAYYELRVAVFPLDDIEAWQAHYGEKVDEEFLLDAIGSQIAYSADTDFKAVLLAGKSHLEAQKAADEYRPGRRGGGGRAADPATQTKKIVKAAAEGKVTREAAKEALVKALAELDGMPEDED